MATTTIRILAVICLSALTLAQDVRLPPTIIKGPARFTYYREGHPLDLQCEAHGVPEPMIDWYKNGETVDISLTRLDVKLNGNLSFNPLSIMDNGTYQCFARNRYGRSMSSYAHLVRAKLAGFTHSFIKEQQVDEGKPLVVPCQTGASTPLPAFTWLTATSKTDARPKRVPETDRVNVDQFGNLIFANVKMSDHKPNRLYLCRAFNFMIGSLEQGSYTRIVVVEKDNPPRTAPKLVYSPKGSNVVGLVGSKVTLQCVFSGNPTPIVSWTRENNLQMSSRVNQATTQVKTILEISNLQNEDEGVYICEGRNSEGTERVPINVDVQAIPYFSDNEHDRPNNINATQGDDVTFKCDPKAEPQPNIQWYINGKKIHKDGPGPGAKRKISDDLETLTVHDVCKTDCGVADLMNVQCEASNIHGSVFTDGYLNVLEDTVFTVEPVDPAFKYGGTAQFECAAVSDPATPVEITWFKDDIQIGYVEDRIWKDPDTNTLHIDAREEKDHGKNRPGKYTCRASNGVSTKYSHAQLKRPLGPVPEERVGKGGFALWWLILLIVLILLFLIFLLCCCICLQRNRGDTYPVDEKERKNGNDPEKELADQRMQDYQRPEDEPMKGSRASLSSTIKMESDDEGSLAEYGDLDPMNFNEEGSFIGQYNKADKKSRRAADSTV